MSVVEELSGVGSRIVTPWKRTTVADGDWLQHNTIGPLNERDVFLAEKIDELSGNSDDKLEEEISARKKADTLLSETIDTFSGEYIIFKSNVESSASELNDAITALNADLDNEKINRENADNILSAQIENLKAATDVIAVFGTYSEFATATGTEWQETVTDNDFIKILNDDTVSSNQVYYEYHTSAHQDWSGWSAVFDLDPYYTQAQTNNLIANSIDSISSVVANNYLSANRDAISAGKNIEVVEQNGPVIGIKTLDNVEFTTLNGQNVNNIINSAKSGAAASAWIHSYPDLIGSAQYGKFAYNVISGDKFSAVGTTTSTAYISGGFGIKAGNGVGVSLEGKNIVITAEGTTYNDSTYISTANKTISVTNDLINSAKSGRQAYDYVTNSATFVQGPGISFYSAGPNQLGISAEGQTLVPGRFIAIGQDNSINLSSDIVVDNISANQKLYLSGTTGGNYYYNTITYSSVDMIKAGSPGPELHFNSYDVSSIVSGQSHQSIITSITWNEITNMNNRFVSASPNAAGSVLVANTAIKLVVTSNLPTPSQMEDNTYYIV